MQSLRFSILTTLALLLLSASAHAQLVGGQWEKTWQFDGQVFKENVGASVSGAGDVDGDGFDDVIVGAPGANPGGLSDAGSAYVYSGATGTLLWRFDGLAAGDRMGNSVSDAGDVDGDGFDDLIVGAIGTSPGGSAYVFSGATGSLIWQFDGLAAGDGMGKSVSDAGDVDGDGTPDLIVGARGADPVGLVGAGSAYVYSGATGTLLWQFDGLAAGDGMGNSVSDAGDVDGDGFADVIIGANGADPGGLLYAGSAYVYSGATGALLWQFDGQAGSDEMGRSVSGTGDVDGDGFDDVVVGAMGANPGGLSDAGSAYVFSGATGSLIWQFDGQGTQYLLGTSVSGAGDVDGDGIDDVIVGASWASPGGVVQAGSAYIFSGASGALIQQFDGQVSGDDLGASVSGAGDVDGDGFDDVIVGAINAEPGGSTGQGSAYVYSLDPFFDTDSTEISYSANQPVQFTLDFPASEADAQYAILLSTSGIGPSLFNGLDIPIAQDTYFQQFLGNPTLHGTLNANAQAQKNLRLHPRTPPGAVGRTIYLAAVTFDAGTQAGRMSSIVRYLSIVP